MDALSREGGAAGTLAEPRPLLRGKYRVAPDGEGSGRAGRAVPSPAGLLASALFAGAVGLGTVGVAAGALVLFAGAVTVAMWRWPALTLSGFLLATVFHATISSFGGFDPLSLVAEFIAMVLVVFALRIAVTRREALSSLGLAALAAYLVVSAIHAGLVGDVGLAARAAGVIHLPMTLVVVCAIWPWPVATLRRLVWGMLVVGLLVCGYALFRYIVGPSAEESAYSTFGGFRNPNVRAGEVIAHLPFSGSKSLGAFLAALVPYALALSLGALGRKRWLALAVAGLGASLVVVTESRMALTAVGLACAVVVVVTVISRTTSARARIRAGALSALGVIVGVGMFAFALSDTSQERYLSLIQNPENDPSVELRVERYDAMLTEIAAEPLGVGLGETTAPGRILDRDLTLERARTINVENSILALTLEQGVMLGILLVIALATLWGALARGALVGHPSERTYWALGGLGALTGLTFILSVSPQIGAAPMGFAWTLVGIGLAGAIRIWREPAQDENRSRTMTSR